MGGRKLIIVLGLSSLILLVMLMFLFAPSDGENLDSAIENPSVDSAITGEFKNSPNTNTQAQNRNAAGRNTQLLDGEDRDRALFQNSFDVLLEIAQRISVEQMSEANNELQALLIKLNELEDEQKLAFLEFFVSYMNDNVFNPEAVTAFDQLWSDLDMDIATRLMASSILAPHYLQHYEIQFAIDHYEHILQLRGSLETEQFRDLSVALFRMGEYEQAIPYLQEHMTLNNAASNSIARLQYSHLFEAYYRIGDLAGADLIGQEILARFDDLQDWKDMQQFYESIGDQRSLTNHMQDARQHGYVSRDGDWIE